MGLQGFSVMEQKIGRIREGHFPPHSRGLAPRSLFLHKLQPPGIQKAHLPGIVLTIGTLLGRGPPDHPPGELHVVEGSGVSPDGFSARRTPPSRDSQIWGAPVCLFAAPYPERKRAVTSAEPTPLSPDTPSTPPIMAKTLLRIASL